MKIKKFTIITILTLIIIIYAIITFIQIIPPIIIIKRHVNPAAENEQIPYSIFLTILILKALDNIAKTNFTGTTEELKILASVNIPQKYKYIMDRFLQLMNEVTTLLNETNQLLNEAEALINIGKGQNAMQLLDQASQKLALANVTYQTLKTATDQLTNTFALPRKDIFNKLDEIGDLINKMYQRLLLYLEKIKEQEKLIETFLTITVTPETIWTGDKITIQGKLNSKYSPLPNKQIIILIDGKILNKITTEHDGTFNIITNIPYIYKPTITIQAQYIPDNIDSKIYKPTTSNAVKINLLYIKPIITLQTTNKTLPGKSFTIKGTIQANKTLPYSQIKITWIEKTITTTINNNTFTATLYTPPIITDGIYTLKVEAPPYKIFAPAQTTAYIIIQRIPLNITLDIPSMVIAGIDRTIKGEIISNEQLNATITLAITGQIYRVNTTSNEFQITLNLPLTLLTGHYNFEIYVQPQYPWYNALSVKGQILIINPLTIIIPLTTITLITLNIVEKRKRNKAQYIEEKIVETIQEKKIQEKTYLTIKELQWLIDLYWEAVTMISNMTRIEMIPSMTLREYLKAVTPYISPICKNFEILTIATEKALYSREITTEELILAKEAASKIYIEYAKI
jgi:RNAse (barnase) inhibitor barstar